MDKDMEKYYEDEFEKNSIVTDSLKEHEARLEARLVALDKAYRGSDFDEKIRVAYTDGNDPSIIDEFLKQWDLKEKSQEKILKRIELGWVVLILVSIVLLVISALHELLSLATIFVFMVCIVWFLVNAHLFGQFEDYVEFARNFTESNKNNYNGALISTVVSLTDQGNLLKKSEANMLKVNQKLLTDIAEQIENINQIKERMKRKNKRD